jgi:hypothetical protein
MAITIIAVKAGTQFSRWRFREKGIAPGSEEW